MEIYVVMLSYAPNMDNFQHNLEQFFTTWPHYTALVGIYWITLEPIQGNCSYTQIFSISQLTLSKAFAISINMQWLYSLGY